MERARIVLAGATGDLGARIARALRERGADLRVLVREDSARAKVRRLNAMGAEVVAVDYQRHDALARGCEGATCVVSALSGLAPVIVGAQSRLIDAAVAAGCPRFVPSDFAIDYTKLPPGTNRNLDLRRELRARLDAAPIAATSILCGAFADLLTGPMPLVRFRARRVLFWEDADQPMDFTTRSDVAIYTAAAALDPTAPRFLRIAGDTISARALAATASDVSGRSFRVLRAGSLRSLDAMIAIARRVAPGGDSLYPAWQGMQYTRDMFDGRGRLEPLDNGRYGAHRWTSVRDVLAAHLASASRRAPGRPVAVG